jgi:hypothetical protein
VDEIDLQTRTVCAVGAVFDRNSAALLRLADKLAWRRTLREREIAELLTGFRCPTADEVAESAR